jgi:hypothetical protein
VYNSKKRLEYLYFRFEWQYLAWRWIGFHWEESYELAVISLKWVRLQRMENVLWPRGKALKWIWKEKTWEFCNRSICFQKIKNHYIKWSLLYRFWNKQAYGIFFDNTFRTFWFCHERRNVTSFGQKEERWIIISSMDPRMLSLVILTWLVSQNYHLYGLWDTINGANSESK